MSDEKRLYEEVGKRVRTLRERQDEPMSQAQLASVVGLERTSITNIESGNQKFPLHVLYRICKALNADIEDLLPSLRERRAAQASAGNLVLGNEFSDVAPALRQVLEKVLR